MAVPNKNIIGIHNYDMLSCDQYSDNFMYLPHSVLAQSELEKKKLSNLIVSKYTDPEMK